SPEATLDAALANACERGTLLCTYVVLAGEKEPLYFINSQLGRAAVEQIERGGWLPGFADAPVEIIPPRPNIFRLYEDNIGPLTPMIADTLKDAEKEYPASWLEEAIRIAVENNARSWRFVQVVLERWRREGKKDATSERPAEQD